MITKSVETRVAFSSFGSISDNAFAAFEDDVRGSLKAGKLADITVCDLNLMEIDPADILDMNVEMTIVDGEIVFRR